MLWVSPWLLSLLRGACGSAVKPCPSVPFILHLFVSGANLSFPLKLYTVGCSGNIQNKCYTYKRFLLGYLFSRILCLISLVSSVLIHPPKGYYAYKNMLLQSLKGSQLHWTLYLTPILDFSQSTDLQMTVNLIAAALNLINS